MNQKAPAAMTAIEPPNASRRPAASLRDRSAENAEATATTTTEPTASRMKWFAEITMVASISTRGRNIPFHVFIGRSPANGLKLDSYVKCEQVLTVSKTRLLGFLRGQPAQPRRIAQVPGDDRRGRAARKPRVAVQVAELADDARLPDVVRQERAVEVEGGGRPLGPQRSQRRAKDARLVRRDHAASERRLPGRNRRGHLGREE